MARVVNDLKLLKLIMNVIFVVKRLKPRCQRFRLVVILNTIGCSLYLCLATIFVMTDRKTYQVLKLALMCLKSEYSVPL